MRCRSCTTKNSEDRRFCAECGAPLDSICTACGFVNSAVAKYCGGCGKAITPTTQSVAAESPRTRTAGVPSEVTQKNSETEASRRQLSVMFCDLVGSTALSERLDPEDFNELLAAYRETCAAVITRFEGHVGRYIGDGLLVCFGYPRAHEDDAQRAVRTGLGIVDAIDALNPRLPYADVTLSVRIGIHTGLVVVGDVGKGEQRERMGIVGDTPNIAARLLELAEPGTVVIGEATRRLVEGMFGLDALGPQRLKGISEPMTVYRVREQTDVDGSYQATARLGATPLVGREEEVNLLLKRWEQANDGEGQVVLFSGESGVGKSRILRAFQERADNEFRNRVLYYCSPYHCDTPFYPLIDQFRRALRFMTEDSEEQKLDKLENLLRTLDLPVSPLAPLFASLLSIPATERYPALELSPEDMRKKTLEACLTMLKASAAREPVFMVVEDLHWADPSMLELLNIFVEHINSERVLLICTFRPDLAPPWTDQPHVSLIALKRLSSKQSAELVGHVSGGKLLPDLVLDQIVDKTDGVPLFVEELTKMVLESGLLTDKGDRFEFAGLLPRLAIPASLQDSLMARLDRLASAKEVAQLAATIGRNFRHELLAALSRFTDSVLDEALTRLIAAGLLYRRGFSPDVIYEFKHVIMQEVAYNSLLRSKRQQLHKEIAGLLEQRFPEIADLQPELLAHHYREAAMAERAIPFELQAGDAAAARYARAEATAHYQTAVEMSRSLTRSENSVRYQIEAILKLANVAANREQFERDLDNLQCARGLAEEIDDDSLLSKILYWIGRTHYVLGQFGLGIEYAQKSLHIAEALGGADDVTAEPVNLLARIHCLRGEPREASQYAARNLAQMHALGNSIEEAAIAGVLAFANGLHGEFPDAFEAAERGVEISKTTGHLPTMAACFMFYGVVRGWHGDVESASVEFERAIAICSESNDIFREYVTYGWWGEACLLADDLDTAQSNLKRCLELGNLIGTSFHRGAFLAFLAKVRLLQGDTDAALSSSEEALNVAIATDETWSRSIALRIRAEILLACGRERLAEAEKSIREAVEIQEMKECRCDLAWSHLVSGQVFAAKGELGNAREVVAAAGALFDDMRMPRGQAKTRAAMDLVAAEPRSVIG